MYTSDGHEVGGSATFFFSSNILAAILVEGSGPMPSALKRPLLFFPSSLLAPGGVLFRSALSAEAPLGSALTEGPPSDQKEKRRREKRKEERGRECTYFSAWGGNDAMQEQTASNRLEQHENQHQHQQQNQNQ